MNTHTLFTVPTWLREFLDDSFRKYLCLALALTGIAVAWFGQDMGDMPQGDGKTVQFFFHPTCPHCRKQKIFNQYLKGKYPKAAFVEYDTSLPENAKILADVAGKRSREKAGVPTTIIGPYTIVGFDSEETTGVALEKAMKAYLQDDPTLFPETDQAWRGQETVAVPLLGEIRPADYSLPLLAVIIGLVDGFNPCAMWVLVYLISLIVTIQDRRKIWFLVGSFLLASGVLYFLFMTAWLNVFLLIGYLRFLTLGVGLMALGAGILSLQEYMATKGELACKIGDAQSKKQTLGRIERIVNAPLNLASVVSVITLAFIVNSIEFACSAALPAIFTHTLALRHLPALHYYSYILLYDFFFMLDDMIIFSLAVLAMDTALGHRYAKYCKIIGGVVLVVLGTLMVFTPGALR